MSGPLRDARNQMDKWTPALQRFFKRRFERGERYGLDMTLAFILISGAMWLFLHLVAAAVTAQDLLHLDQRIHEMMAGVLTPGLTTIVVAITTLGGIPAMAVGVVAVGTLLLVKRRWWSLFGLLFAMGGGGLIVFGLKAFFGRARPVEQVVEAGGFAFPSGHAFAATVFFGYLIYLSWKHLRRRTVQAIVTTACLVLILLIGTSRIYLSVHWLTDVLGGYVAGIIWLVTSILIVRHVEWQDRFETAREKARDREDMRIDVGGM